MFVTWYVTILVFFFFQAEDGIRDLTVTGVQTCALPISRRTHEDPARGHGQGRARRREGARGGEAQGGRGGLLSRRHARLARRDAHRLRRLRRPLLRWPRRGRGPRHTPLPRAPPLRRDGPIPPQGAPRGNP